MSKVIVFAAALVSMLAITACETGPTIDEQIAAGTMERLTAEELTEHISGNTEIWKDKGAGYFQPDGTFLANWKGDKVDDGTWWVDGSVRCYDNLLWGEYCHEFFRRDGEILHTRVGTEILVLPTRMVEGNQL